MAELQRNAGRGRARRHERLGPREIALFDLAQDAAQERRLRAALRHHGVPRHRRRCRRLLSRAGHASTAAIMSCPAASRTTSRRPSPTITARCTPASSGPSGSASRSRSAPATCTRSPNSASPRTGSTSRAPAATEGPQYRWLRELLDILEHALEPGGISRAHQARDVPGPGVLLHAQGRSDRAAARRDAGRFRLCRAFRRSATPASAPRSTAGWCRCARSSATATRSRSSPRRRRRRRRPGSASSSPARRAPASAASSAPSSATQYLDLGKAILQKAFRQEGHEFTEKAARARC